MFIRCVVILTVYVLTFEGSNFCMKKGLRGSLFLVAVLSVASLSGCANYEVNTNRGNIPGKYIRYEMQEADRALETARLAGKDQICPAEFKAAEDAKNNSYDVFRSCRTEEGAALAKKATEQANALCPVRVVE
jgi:OOP family OmpA-OmpF porin